MRPPALTQPTPHMSELQFNRDRLIADLNGTALSQWADKLADAVLGQEHALKHGHLPGWDNAVSSLPACDDARLEMDQGVVAIRGSFNKEQTAQLQSALTGLVPWRKGPFSIGPCELDTEWRSDWKWDRIAPHLKSLNNKTVLDVGCGSGYHLWRMRHAGAAQVLGIDPSLLYLKQFEALQTYAQDPAVQFLPLPMEALPGSMRIFDTVFSMGVLYHRREPHPHLTELGDALKAGGELVLETLVIPTEQGQDTGLPISGRYANMRNIYELPSVTRLERWIREAGFEAVRTVSVDTTRTTEQRSTHWMPSYSLLQALDPQNETLTIEGHPRPCRAVVLGTKPD